MIVLVMITFLERRRLSDDASRSRDVSYCYSSLFAVYCAAPQDLTTYIVHFSLELWHSESEQEKPTAGLTIVVVTLLALVISSFAVYSSWVEVKLFA